MNRATKVATHSLTPESNTLTDYLEVLSKVQRLHSLLLDIVKDEFERLGILEINPIQALLLFSVGDTEVTAGELKSRGHYQGSNVSYNLKKLVELGYMSHERCTVDRRSVRVKLTEKGLGIHTMVSNLFQGHVAALRDESILTASDVAEINTKVGKLENFWTNQIRHIY